MEAEPAQGVGAHADDDRAVPVAVAQTAHEVDPYIPYGEGVPVDAPVPQSNRHQPPAAATGDVLEAEEGHPVGSLFAHGHVSVHGRHHGAGGRAGARTKTRTHNPHVQEPAADCRIEGPDQRAASPAAAAKAPRAIRCSRAAVTPRPGSAPAARGGVSSSGGRRPSAPPSGRWARSSDHLTADDLHPQLDVLPLQLSYELAVTVRRRSSSRSCRVMGTVVEREVDVPLDQRVEDRLRTVGLRHPALAAGEQLPLIPTSSSASIASSAKCRYRPGQLMPPLLLFVPTPTPWKPRRQSGSLPEDLLASGGGVGSRGHGSNSRQGG